MLSSKMIVWEAFFQPSPEYHFRWSNMISQMFCFLKDQVTRAVKHLLLHKSLTLAECEVRKILELNNVETIKTPQCLNLESVLNTPLKGELRLFIIEEQQSKRLIFLERLLFASENDFLT